MDEIAERSQKLIRKKINSASLRYAENLNNKDIEY